MEEGDGETCESFVNLMSDETKRPTIPDGIQSLNEEMPAIMRMVAEFAWWVHPDAFVSLPLWYPEFRRGQKLYDRKWTRHLTNTRQVSGEKLIAAESNRRAKHALISALGRPRNHNMAVCHIWGYENSKYSTSDSFVTNPLFYSCVGNMVLLPAPLKSFTDHIENVRMALKYCALQLYPWPEKIREHLVATTKPSGEAPPANYPADWPREGIPRSPLKTAPFSSVAKAAIQKRKSEISVMLKDEVSFPSYPRDQVQTVLATWNIEI